MPKLVGTEPYQVPRNADLGTMAYQDADFLSINSMLATGNISSNNILTANLAINSATSNLRFKSVGNFSIETGSNSTKFYNNTYKFIFDSGTLQNNNDSGIILTTASNVATPGVVLESNNAGTVIISRLFSNQIGASGHEFNLQVGSYNGLKILKSENRETSVFMSPITESIGAKLVVRNRWDGAPGLRLSRLANTTTADIMQVTDDTQSVRYMTIANTGNVGISTTTPNANLHIYGTTLFSRLSAASTDDILRVGNENNSTVFVAVSNTGNVGIGQTQIFDKFVVRNGNIRVETGSLNNGGLRIHTPNSLGANATIKFGLDNVALEKGIFFNRDDSRISIFNNATASVFEEILTVAANSRVGIKTTTPVVELDVNGIIKTRTYTVATLPSAASVGAGSRAYVSDSLTNTYLSIATGGGANGVLVFSNGTNWLLG